MSQQLELTTQELLKCAEALSEAVSRRDLDAVEFLLSRRQDLLAELRSLDVPAGAMPVRELDEIQRIDRNSQAALANQREGVGEELDRVRNARRAAGKREKKGAPSHFVSTRC